jgi:glucose dehydrogenase
MQPPAHGFRAAARKTFAVALTVISAIAAFAIAGDAAHDDANWILPAKSYAGNRYTNLAQINPGTVKSLRLTWRTAIEDDGEQEAAPLIWNGTMFVSTPHDGVLALDAGSGHLRWHRPYDPAYVILYAVNRGVGLGDGKVFIATQDCHLIALDAATGKTLWNVQGCRDISNSFYSMAAYVYRNEVIVGTGVATTVHVDWSAPFASATASAFGIGKRFPVPAGPVTGPGPETPGSMAAGRHGTALRSMRPRTRCSLRLETRAPTWS